MMDFRSRTLAWVVVIALVGGLMVFPAVPTNAQTRVQINGQPLVTSVSPVTVRGRTLVPMRDIFESLGATVNWYSDTRTVIAQRDGTTVQLPVGRQTAYVNGQAVTLDVPATIVRGNTMVPLRFVSESLGADVVYIPETRTVSITTTTPVVVVPPGPGAGGRTARMAVPSGTVLPVVMEDRLSSTTADVGDTFTTSLRSEVNGDQPFPRGSAVIGVVTDVQVRSGSSPGIIDVDFTSVRLPDGRRVAIDGSLIALDSRSVETRDGRLVARSSAPSQAQFIGWGAGVGLVIGLFTDNVIRGTLLGAAAGYIASLFSRNRARDVVIEPGTEFGVRLDRSVAWQASQSFAAARNSYLASGGRFGAGSGAGRIESFNLVMNGSHVDLNGLEPIMVSNTVLVPLDPVLDEVNIDLDWNRVSNQVRIVRPDGSIVRMTVGQDYATLNGVRESLETPAVVRSGVLFVPPGFLALATGQNVTWDPDSNTLFIRSLQ